MWISDASTKVLRHRVHGAVAVAQNDWRGVARLRQRDICFVATHERRGVGRQVIGQLNLVEGQVKHGCREFRASLKDNVNALKKGNTNLIFRVKKRRLKSFHDEEV